MKLAFLAVLGLANACVTGGTQQAEFKKSRIIERAEGYEETPKFARKSGMSEEGQDAIYTNVLTLSGNARPEGCLEGASSKARSQMVRYISEAITTSGQLSESDASSDPAVESLTAYLSQNKLHGLRSLDEYWHREEVSDESGNRVLKLKCAVKVAIQKSLLAKQLRQAIDGAPQGNPEIRKQLLSAQKEFIESIGDQGVAKDSARTEVESVDAH